jgi:hypothetical protein
MIGLALAVGLTFQPFAIDNFGCDLASATCEGSPVAVDKPPCPKPGLLSGTLEERTRCTPWVIREHYFLRHTAPWPHDGDVCDPKTPPPAGYECHDEDGDHPPPGMLW